MQEIKHRIPMIFPGQGSQTVGMARDLAEGDDAAARFLATADEALGFGLADIMFEGPAEKLTETWNAQPALLAHSVAVGLALREMGIGPSVVAGHSLGEFSAAVIAGALEPADGLRLVRRRGELMFAAGEEVPGTMAAVLGLPGAEVARVCAEVAAEKGVVVPANYNSEGQVVISGEVEAVHAAEEPMKAAGARRFAVLNVSGAFHSPLLEGAAAQFKAGLEAVAVADAEVPLVANVTASPVQAAAELKKGFGDQLTSPVLWQDIMKAIAGDGPRIVLEVGAGKVLTGLARRAFPEVDFVPVGTREDLAGVLEKIEAAS